MPDDSHVARSARPGVTRSFGDCLQRCSLINRHALHPRTDRQQLFKSSSKSYRKHIRSGCSPSIRRRYTKCSEERSIAPLACPESYKLRSNDCSRHIGWPWTDLPGGDMGFHRTHNTYGCRANLHTVQSHSIHWLVGASILVHDVRSQ
jgi:hypothetical protein